jgi:hypothetical protein
MAENAIADRDTLVVTVLERSVSACGSKEGSFSLLTRHLFLIPARRDSET